jgi:periplasmic protein TonB
MFDDFRPNPQTHRLARRRFQASLTAATLIFGASTAAAISATSAIRAPVQEEELSQVEFKQKPPEPPAPLAEPAPPEPVEAPKPLVEKPRPKKLKTPTKIPDKVLPESDRALSEAVAVGPVDGVIGGTGVAPAPPPPPPPPPPPVVKPPKPQPIVLPVPQSTPQPKYSSMARRKGIEGVVLVEFDVLENGSTANIKIVSGAPELWDTVVKTVGAWRYKPASRGGRPQRYRVQQRIIFSLQDA